MENHWFGLLGGIRIETHRFRLLLLALCILLAAAVLEDLLPDQAPLLALATTAVLFAVLLAVSHRRFVFWIGMLLALPTFAGIWAPFVSAPEVVGPLGLATRTLLFGLGGLYVLARVFALERIGEEAVVGAICSWVLFAVTFAAIYALIDTLVPAAFRTASGSEAGPAVDHLYFSFVTLTTLGYGDTLAVAPTAKAVVIVESVLGVLYPSIVVARLVALYTAGGERAPAVTRGARPSGSSAWWLLLALVASIVLGPAVYAAGGWIVLAAVQAGILLSGVLALRDARWVLWLASPLVLAALVRLAWMDAPASVAAVGDASEVLVLSAVIFGIGRREFRSRRVSRDSLVAVTCLYLMLGWMFSIGFRLLDSLSPGSLSIAPMSPAIHSWELLYFSFMTLTTTGFGDITPLAEAARMLAGFEATVGIFFPAVLVARLVSLYDVGGPGTPPRTSIGGATPGSNPSTLP